MSLKLVKDKLSSRVIRKKVTGRSDGLRIFTGSGFLQETKDGVIWKILSTVAKFTGFIFSVIWKVLGGAFQLSWAAVWGGIVSSANFIWHFNLNITEEEVHEQIEGSFRSIAAIAGDFAGQAIGWGVTGVLPGLVITAFNKFYGLYVLKEAGEEALQELASELEGVLRVTMNSLARAVFYYTFLAIRKKFFGDKQRDKKPWSIAKAVEEKIEEITEKHQVFGSFLESFLDGAGEGLIQGGYATAMSMQSYAMGQQQVAKPAILGADKTIEVDFNRKKSSD